MTVCPCSGLVRGAPDLEPLARQIQKLLQAQDGIYALPRKFKISLSACADGCAQPFVNDAGLVAARHSGTWDFRVIVAGSLGARPATGIELFERLPADEVLPLVLAAIRVFAEHGDRANRHKARLRHVRERLGDEAFLALLKDAFANAKQDRSWPTAQLAEAGKAYDAKVALHFVNGDVSADAAESLANLAEQPDTCVRISNHHQVVVFGMDTVRLAEQIAAMPVLGAASRPGPRIVACPGKRWCKRGITHTNSLACRLREQLSDVLPASATVCISGCPNGCAQSGVADFGLVGGLTTVDGVQHEVYNLLTGGGMGRDTRLAKPIAQRLRVEQVIEHIAKGSSQIASPGSP